MFVDLDRFKLINDGIDHAAGDAVLEAVGRALRDVIRAGDTVARFGGDEFVALAEVNNGDEALALANRVRRAVSKPVPMEDGSRRDGQRGVVLTRQWVDPASLLRDADAAMYRAKDSGRNRVEVFSEDVRLRAIEKLELERTLQEAVAADHLRLVFQPTIRLGDGRLAGLEALVRWQHPQRGLPAPGLFIPIAEESDLVGARGNGCRTRLPPGRPLEGDDPRFRPLRAVGQHVAWPVPPHRPGRRSSPGSWPTPASRPRRWGSRSPRAVSMTNTDQFGRAVADLQTLGVSIAIDDFGKPDPRPSATSKKWFPIDVIKIDSSFVQGIGGYPEAALVQACLALAHLLGLPTVAQGVLDTA